MLFHRLSPCALLLSLSFLLACSAGPSDPAITASKTPKIDSMHHALKITPDSGTAKIGAKVAFTLTANPALPKHYSIAWTIDADAITHSNVDTVSNIFTSLGKHALKAMYIDSTGSRRDSTATFITITDTTPPPPPVTDGFGAFRFTVDHITHDTLDRTPYQKTCSALLQYLPYGPGPAQQKQYITVGLSYAQSTSGLNKANLSFVIYIDSRSPGTYPISAYGPGTEASFTVNNNDHFVSQGGGTFTITKFDTVQNLVSATFSSIILAHQMPNLTAKDFDTISGSFSNVGIEWGAFGQGSISAETDGTPFRTTFSANYGMHANVDPAGLHYQFVSYDSIGSRMISVTINTPTVGTIPIQGYGALTGTAGASFNDSKNGVYFGTNPQGALTITSFDTVNRRISGKFSFSATSSTGATAHVTNGVIDNVIWARE